MPIPFTPSEIVAILPDTAKTVCEKVKGIPLFITGFTENVSWMWDDDGTISDAWAAEICQINCFVPPVIPPDDDCTTLVVSAYPTAGDANVRITFTGQIGIGFTYVVQRTTTPETEVSWTDISSGVATQNGVLYFSDDSVSNGTTYYYRLKIHNGSCDDSITGNTSATPTAANTCPQNNIVLSLSSTVQGRIDIALTGVPATGLDFVEIHASYDLTVGETLALPTGGSANTWYHDVGSDTRDIRYTVYLRKTGCSQTDMLTGTVTPFAAAPTAPSISLASNQTEIRWSPVPGMSYYRIYRQSAVGSNPIELYIEVAQSSQDIVVQILNTDWPQNMGFGTPNPPYAHRSYYIWVRSVSARGIESGDSNRLHLYR